MASLSAAKNKLEDKASSKAKAAIEFARQSERLAQYSPSQEDDTTGSTQALEAKFITPNDPVIQTADGGRLPAVPVEDAIKLNHLKDILDGRELSETEPTHDGMDSIHGARPSERDSKQSTVPEAPLRHAVPPSRTHPLFPPLPLYGPPSMLLRLQCWTFRATSAVLSLCFLLVIILGAAFTSIPLAWSNMWLRLTFRNPDKRRPFYEEEEKRKKARKLADRAWDKKKKKLRYSDVVEGGTGITGDDGNGAEDYAPLEGGADPIVCDVSYYARRVGLDVEIFDVQTEDGFIIELWHLYNPKEYRPASAKDLQPHSPDVFLEQSRNGSAPEDEIKPGNKKYPILLIHGLLQSAGAYCTNDDDSLAFFLAKSGYDVWLGNNRCGFRPRHNMLQYNDPRMWAWNIRQMGCLDLPALISRVLSETGFEKLGLIAHSQGTTQTLVALAKEQRPDIGPKISVFCGLAPAAYAGPLIGKMYFKFMRVISPGMFRVFFGIHAFIPFMMVMHKMLPGNFYGAMGYRVFAFLFNWTDERWERDLRDRMFQFAPVYVSAESMRWWLGRECFARQKCILATREEKTIEDREDEEEDQLREELSSDETSDEEDAAPSRPTASQPAPALMEKNLRKDRILHHQNTDNSRYAWYGPQTPPFALWVCGADDLVDGRRLLRRFDRNREPHVDLVHSKIIEGYEHLDPLWSMDSIEKVGKEVRQVLWRTAPESARKLCRTPKGCEDITEFYTGSENRGRRATSVDASAGEWSEKGRHSVEWEMGERSQHREAEGRSD